MIDSTMSSLKNQGSAEYDELFEEYQELKKERSKLIGECQALAIVQQERDLAIAAYQGMRTELEGMRQENKALRDFKFRTMAICSQPHEVFSPYTKIAAIVGPEQPTYAASEVGGDANVRITSMTQWNKAINGTDDNSNCIAKNIPRLLETGVLKRTEVKLSDGRKVYSNEWDENLLRHPRLIEVETPRPNTGGNKRCPQCGGFCKKKFIISYECEKCGIDFDANMKPIDHTPAVVPIVSVKAAPIEASSTQEVIDDSEWRSLLTNAGLGKGKAS